MNGAKVERDPAIQEVIDQHALSRLAHFTPGKSLGHILRDETIRSSADLASKNPEYFDPTDVARFDHNPDKVCCSYSYPNPFYFSIARERSHFKPFPDWFCLLLDIDLIHREGTVFCPRNAAAGGGSFQGKGAETLRECFAPVSGAYARGARAPYVATDLQAEALVPGPIDMSHLIAIVASSEAAAGNAWARLQAERLDPSLVKWLVAATLFQKYPLSTALLSGAEIVETPWAPPLTDRKETQ